MIKIFISILLIFMTYCANAVIFTQETQCTWTPWDSSYSDNSGNWYSECDNVPVTGIALCSSQDGNIKDVSISKPTVDTSENRDENNIHCWCKMTTPYEGAWVYRGVHTAKEGYCDGSDPLGTSTERCSRNCGDLWLVKNSGNPWLDNYRYGFHGTDAELTQIKNGLFTPVATEKTCEIGISKIITSTGGAFALYSEKYTEHALVVQYNNQKCYAKMESGHGHLNFRIDDIVHHLVE